MRFHQKVAALALAANAALSSFGAQAASIEVRVAGTITPGSCTPTMAGGGTVDYGTIAANQLSQTGYTLLSEKEVGLSISCDAPTKLAVRAVDNRHSSVVPGILSGLGVSFTSDSLNYGLGTASNAKIGGFALLMKPGTFTADSVAVYTTSSMNNGTSWLMSLTGGVLNVTNSLMSWSTKAGGPPIAVTNLSGIISVQAALNKASELNLTSDVSLDGSATLELVYL
ncbi:DUF1120 domain-containing protein [Pseudomonas sp. AMR01]|uniref:DUF1120 domain-containing protein n=1 Tax=Pseudomonas sp. AMR01 TaxID=3064904 RepID=UPI0035BFC699